VVLDDSKLLVETSDILKWAVNKENFDILHKVRDNVVEPSIRKQLNIPIINGHNSHELEEDEHKSETLNTQDVQPSEFAQHVLDFDQKLRKLSSYAETSKFENYLNCSKVYGTFEWKNERNHMKDLLKPEIDNNRELKSFTMLSLEKDDLIDRELLELSQRPEVCILLLIVIF